METSENRTLIAHISKRGELHQHQRWLRELSREQQTLGMPEKREKKKMK